MRNINKHIKMFATKKKKEYVRYQQGKILAPFGRSNHSHIYAIAKDSSTEQKIMSAQAFVAAGFIDKNVLKSSNRVCLKDGSLSTEDGRYYIDNIKIV